MKKKLPVKKLRLSSETLLQLDPGQAGGARGGTLTFEGDKG